MHRWIIEKQKADTLKIEMLKIYSEEFKDKHRHFWHIYTMFVYADVGMVIAILVRKLYKSDPIFNNHKAVIIGCLAIFYSTMSAILVKEYIVVKKMGVRYDSHLEKLGYSRLPMISLNWTGKILDTKVRTSSLMCLFFAVLIVISFIIIVSELYGTDGEALIDNNASKLSRCASS